MSTRTQKQPRFVWVREEAPFLGRCRLTQLLCVHESGMLQTC